MVAAIGGRKRGDVTPKTCQMRQFDKATVVDEELHDLKLRFELLGDAF